MDIDKMIDKIDRSTPLRNQLSDIDRNHELDALSDIDARLESLKEDLEEDSRKTRHVAVWTLIVAAASLAVALLSLLLTLC